MKITKRQLRRMIRESILTEGHGGYRDYGDDEVVYTSAAGTMYGEEEVEWVVIGNAGQGRQNAWPTSAEPQTYRKAEADKIVADLNSKQGYGHMQVHYHTKPLRRALEYISPGNEVYNSIVNLQRSIGA